MFRHILDEELARLQQENQGYRELCEERLQEWEVAQDPHSLKLCVDALMLAKEARRIREEDQDRIDEEIKYLRESLFEYLEERDDEMDDLMKDYRHRVEAQDIEIRESTDTYEF